MRSFSEEFMYEFHVQDVGQVDALKQYADHAVKEIKSTYGWDTEIQINIEPEVRDKHLFNVSMSVLGLHRPIVVKKEGKDIMAVLRKVRRSVLRQIYRANGKKISGRKKMSLRQKMAS